MRKKRVITFSGWVILFCVQVALAQDRVEAPVWNVGDKWVFTPGTTMEVIKADENGYIVRYPNETILFERSTLNRIYTVQGKMRERYKGAQKRLFDFPLTIGKQWKNTYLAPLKWEDEFSRRGGPSEGEIQFFESHKVLGWEEIEVEAGKFKALKVEYKRQWSSPLSGLKDGKAWYWYSPDVKCLVKLQYEKNQVWGKLSDWELASFHLTK
jgi:hypothetical protein